MEDKKISIVWIIGIILVVISIWGIGAGYTPDSSQDYVPTPSVKKETTLTHPTTGIEARGPLSHRGIEARDPLSHTSNYINIRYRSDNVDIAHPRFEYLNTARSSWIRGAWYDEKNGYMIINLNGVYYHYCSMPRSVWNSFKSASSFGTFYNQRIKGMYDCRIHPVPQY